MSRISPDDLPCRQEDPDLWFSRHRSNEERAKELCLACPVRLLCLERCVEAEKNSKYLPYGIYGALTAAERTKLTGRNPIKQPRERGFAV